MIGGKLEWLQAPGNAEEALLGGGDLALVAQSRECAEQIGMELGDFAALAVSRFVTRADDEAWTGLISAMNASTAPSDAAIATIMRRAVADVREVLG